MCYLRMDYFSENFADEKNCKELREINKMKKLSKYNCASRTVGIKIFYNTFHFGIISKWFIKHISFQKKKSISFTWLR